MITDKDEIYAKYFTQNVIYLVQKHDSLQNIKQNTTLSFLARTTTPRTIPANLALVVSPDIMYAQIYDLKANEYFILAENLISKFYKDSSDYIIIYKCK
ncbi:class I tRNA ligase family protein [Patescibacteria group bacterium]|nr:class I tRNA ligase family protein [Patescibacteria group bacterium]